MAGKAWQSKGCGTCKKRKIKCDEGKPECGQCVKRGVQCPGYEKTRFFVFQEPKSQQQEHDQPQGSTERRESLPLGRSNQFIFEEPSGVRPAKPEKLERPEKPESSRQLTITKRKHSARAQGKTLGPIQTVGSASMVRNQMFSSFFNIYFPNNSCASSNVDLWNYVVTGVSAQPTKTLMLEKAISALSCLHIGKAYRNKSIFNYGLELYNGSIRHMAEMIGRGRFHEDIIYTGVIFQDIETFHSPFGFETWLAHVQGVNSILRHYRPQITENPLLAAIYSQHQTTKEVVSWSMHMMPGEKIRWGTRPTEGGPMVDLIDVFIELSEISVDTDSVDITDQDALQALLSKCLALESKQMRWYARNILHLGKGPIICEPGELQTRIPPVDDVFGPAYRFPSLDDCRLHQVFWMTLSFLYSFIHRIRTIAASNTSWGALAFPSPTQDLNSDLPSVYADKIARTLPYCLQDSMNLWGVCFAVVSIGHISQTFVRNRNLEKFLYTQNVLSIYGDNCFDFCLHLHGYLQHVWLSGSQKSGDIFPEPNEYSSSGSSDGGSPAAVWKV